MTAPRGLKPVTAKGSASFELAPPRNLIPTSLQAGGPQPPQGAILEDRTQQLSEAGDLIAYALQGKELTPTLSRYTGPQKPRG
jgi:hypothetical protein